MREAVEKRLFKLLDLAMSLPNEAVKSTYEGAVLAGIRVPAPLSVRALLAEKRVRDAGWQIVQGAGPWPEGFTEPSTLGYCDFLSGVIAVHPGRVGTLNSLTGRRTLMHECGHALMHKSIWGSDKYNVYKGEWEAELFAHMLVPESLEVSAAYLRIWYGAGLAVRQKARDEVVARVSKALKEAGNER